MTSTYETLRLRVLDALGDESAGSAASTDAPRVSRVIDTVLAGYQADAEKGLCPPLTAPGEQAARLLRSITQAGAFTKYFVDPEMADEVTARKDVITYTTRDGLQKIDPEPTSALEVRSIVDRLLADAGVAVSVKDPVVIAQVWNNQVRASVSIPPVADDLDATFRIYRQVRTTFPQLVEWGAFTPQAANFLSALPLALCGVLISGAPGSGKTTLAQGFLAAIPPTVITRIIQEARELNADHLPGGRWSPESTDHDIRSLVNHSMQFATQFLVVGETRGAEAFELIKAANSGCGFLTTLHAKSAPEAMDSLVTAALMAGENVPERMVRRAFSRLINVVVHCAAEPLHLVPAGRPRLRQVMEICTVPAQASDDQFALEPVFRRERLGAPLEFCGQHALGALGPVLDGVLPDGLTAVDLCTGNGRLW